MLRALDLWLPAYWRGRSNRRLGNPTDIIFAVCDHFEPRHDADQATALERIRLWRREFPKLIAPYVDADGCAPRHTFFYPVEQYHEGMVAELAELCRACGSEVEIHLHHDRDTSDGVREKLERGKENLVRHGLLSRDPAGNVRYGFIHGDWALDNSHPDGRHCGVSNELDVLKQTGCYADFTMPSAPNRTQTRIINSLYYAQDTPEPKSHDVGEPSAVGCRPLPDGLLLVQGPLGFNWERRKFGVLPRIENGELAAANPPRADRLRIWTRSGIHVRGRPEWRFIKLHTHGGIPKNFNMLLGEPMRRLHRILNEQYGATTGCRLHYVTAREMVNILHAAEDGHSGDAGRFRDHKYRLLKPAGASV